MRNQQTFWTMWVEDLPGSFRKTQVIEDLSERWGLTTANVYKRLKNQDFMNLVSDLAYLYGNYGIAFDVKERGFFFDQNKYEAIQHAQDMENAKMFNLSKSLH